MKFDFNFNSLNHEYHNNSTIKSKNLIVIFAVILCLTVAALVFVVINGIKSPLQKEKEAKEQSEAEERGKYYTLSAEPPPFGVQAVIYDHKAYYACPGISLESEEYIGEEIGETTKESIPFTTNVSSQKLDVKDFMRYNCSQGLKIYSFKGDYDAIIIKGEGSSIVLLPWDTYSSIYSSDYKSLLSQLGTSSFSLYNPNNKKSLTVSGEGANDIMLSKSISIFCSSTFYSEPCELRCRFVPGLVLWRRLSYDSSSRLCILYDNIKPLPQEEDFAYEHNGTVYVIRNKEIQDFLMETTA